MPTLLHTTQYTVSDTDCSLPYPGETMADCLVLTQYTVSDTDCSLPYPGETMTECSETAYTLHSTQ